MDRFISRKVDEYLKFIVPKYLETDAQRISKDVAREVIGKSFRAYLSHDKRGGLGVIEPDHQMYWLSFDEDRGGLSLSLDKAVSPSSGWSSSSMDILREVPFLRGDERGEYFESTSRPTKLKKHFAAGPNGEQYRAVWPVSSERTKNLTGVFELKVPRHASHIELLIEAITSAVDATNPRMVAPSCRRW